MPTPLLNLRLDPTRRTELEAVASDRGVDRSAVVRAALDHYLAAGAPGLGHRDRLALELDEDDAAA